MLPLSQNRALSLFTTGALYCLLIITAAESSCDRDKLPPEDDAWMIPSKEEKRQEKWLRQWKDNQNSTGSELDDADRETTIDDEAFVEPLTKVKPSLRRGSCGASSARDGIDMRVSGGYNAKRGQFPSYVFVQVSTGLNFIRCGGTIIGPDLVITAAHCVQSVLFFGAVDVKSLIDVSELKTRGGWIRARKICRSPLYTGLSMFGYPRYDLAILRLERPFQFNKNIQSACLPETPLADNQAYVVGLGMTNKLPVIFAKTLQVLPVKKSFCLLDHHNSILCAQSNTWQNQGDACEADSGGPLYAKVNGAWTVYGVTSYGPDECASGYRGTGVYVDLYNIRSHVNSLISQCT